MPKYLLLNLVNKMDVKVLLKCWLCHCKIYR